MVDKSFVETRSGAGVGAGVGSRVGAGASSAAPFGASHEDAPVSVS